MIEYEVLNNNNSTKCIACGDLAELSITVMPEINPIFKAKQYYCTLCAETLADALQEATLDIDKYYEDDEFESEFEESDKNNKYDECDEDVKSALLLDEDNYKNIPCD